MVAGRQDGIADAKILPEGSMEDSNLGSVYTGDTTAEIDTLDRMVVKCKGKIPSWEMPR